MESDRKKNGKVKIRLEHGADFSLYHKEVYHYQLKPQMDLSEEVYQEILHEILIPRAKKRALYLLQKQDRTISNLSEKLRENGYPKEAIDQAIEYAASYHYIDDERYARNYIRYHQQGKSRRRIYEDLLKKGILKEEIEVALDEEYNMDEKEMIAELLCKKNYNQEEADAKEKSKMYRFLVGRGFRSEDITRYL